MAKRHTILNRLTAEFERELERMAARAKAREAAEDGAVIGQPVASIERYMGDVTSITLANGWKLRPRSNDSGESWIEIEEP